MKDLMDEFLQASSQPEAWQIFEEILEGERRQMVTLAGEEGQTEETGAYRKLREEAASGLGHPQGDLRRRHGSPYAPWEIPSPTADDKRDPTADRGSSSAGKGDPNLPQYGLGLAADWSLASREARGVVNEPEVPRHG
ncbi:hypothetical protein GGP94_001844 [Salinibacter ruber]|nr:hypothetical protein [Salinibacter ruber]